MIVGKESEKLEFKKSTAELREGVISMAAILNKHGGGELYFGVHNNGTPVGQEIGADTLRDISQAVSNHLEPKVYPKISEAIIDHLRCIHVEFTGDRSPYLAYGRAYIRVADEDKQMSSAALEDYILRKHMGKDSWDSEPSNKTIDDVDEEVLRRYIERANNVGRIDFPYTAKVDTLTRLDLLRDGKLKNAAAVWFCGESLLELQMAIFATHERLTFLDINRAGGSIMQMMGIAERYVGNNIRYRVEFDGSIERKEIPEIPIFAVREAIINSYCHRDFKSSQNNEVVVYSDRVEIYNPGTFPLGYTPQDFIDGNGSSIKRNPQLAQLMYYVKDIESFGTGIKRISNECIDAGIKVEFEIRKMGFAVIFYRPFPAGVHDAGYLNIVDYKDHDIGKTDENDTINGTINDTIKDTVNDGVNTDRVGVNNGVNAGSILDEETVSTAAVGANVGVNVATVGANVGVNDTQNKILALLTTNPRFTVQQLSDHLGITKRRIESNVKALRELNLIERKGSDKNGHWVVNLPEKAKKSAGEQA